MRKVFKHRRAGKSLIETTAVIAIMGLLLPVSASIMYFVFQAKSVGTEEMTTTLALSRLGPQFRNDLHRATAINLKSLQAGELEMTIDQPEKNIVTYRTTPKNLVRTVTREEKSVAREVYRFPDRNITMQLTSDSRWGTVRIGPRMPANNQPTTQVAESRIWKVTAEVGRNARQQAGGTE